MVTTADLVSYYKLDEPSGDAADSHGSNTGIATGIVYGNSGIINDSFTFTASSADNVNTFVPTGTAFTWNIWVYFTSTAGAQTYRAIGQTDFSPTGVGADLGFSAGIPKFFFPYGTNWDALDATTDFDGLEDEWHMITVTYDDSDNELRIYVDGTSENSLTTTGNVSWGSDDILIGNRVNLDRGFPGRLDEVAIFDAKLSSGDVSDLWNSGAGLAYPFAAGPPTIDETDTTTLSDSLTTVRVPIPRLISEADTTTLSDSLNAVSVRASRLISESDTTTLSDSLNLINVRVSRLISEADTTTLSDSLSLIKISDNTITESDITTLSDSLALESQLNRILSDTATLSDSLAIIKVSENTISETDTVTLSDSLTIVCDKCPRIIDESDTTTLSDSLIFNSNFNRIFTDTTTLSDSLTIAIVSPTVTKTIAGQLSKAFNETLGRIGIPIKIDYFTSNIGSVYDEPTSLSLNKTVWTSGAVFPLKTREGSSDSVLLEEGKLINSDRKLYVNGSTAFAGLDNVVKIQLGSPTGDIYSTIPLGGKAPEISNVKIYKKQYIRYLQTGSF